MSLMVGKPNSNVSFGAKINTLDAISMVCEARKMHDTAQNAVCKAMTNQQKIKVLKFPDILNECKKALLNDERFKKVEISYNKFVQSLKKQPSDTQVLEFKLKSLRDIFNGIEEIEVSDVKTL